MERIVCAETRETITGWESFDAIRRWAAIYLYPIREENDTLIVETNEWDYSEDGKVPAVCVYRFQEIPDSTLDSKPAQPIAFQPTPTHSDDAENAGGGDNSTGTDGRTIIKIENSPSEANCGTSHGDQELAQNEGEESPAPERNPDRKSPLPTPSEAPR